jgi:hypothetical protein
MLEDLKTFKVLFLFQPSDRWGFNSKNESKKGGDLAP